MKDRVHYIITNEQGQFIMFNSKEERDKEYYKLSQLSDSKYKSEEMPDNVMQEILQHIVEDNKYVTKH